LLVQCTVVTGKDRGSGTDADVFLEILGDAKSEQVPLAAGTEAFERGGTDVFQLQTDQLGNEVLGVVLSINNRGSDPDWQVSSILLENKETGRVRDIYTVRMAQYRCSARLLLSDSVLHKLP
jgi:hypothetical protein